MVRVIKFFLTVGLAGAVAISGTFLPQKVYAQANVTEEKVELTGTRKQLATIVFAGLAGAILGLSTLSFYGRPQDHLSNIAIGFAVGVIGGAIFTTYRVATKPYDAYEVTQRFEKETQLQFLDESSQRQLAFEQSQFTPKIGWSWQF